MDNVLIKTEGLKLFDLASDLIKKDTAVFKHVSLTNLDVECWGANNVLIRVDGFEVSLNIAKVNKGNAAVEETRAVG